MRALPRATKPDVYQLTDRPDDEATRDVRESVTVLEWLERRQRRSEQRYDEDAGPDVE